MRYFFPYAERCKIGRLRLLDLQPRLRPQDHSSWLPLILLPLTTVQLRLQLENRRLEFGHPDLLTPLRQIALLKGYNKHHKEQIGRGQTVIAILSTQHTHKGLDQGFH